MKKTGSGVMFTLDTESGFRDVVAVSGAYGLGEFIVQGVVSPDEWTVFKPTSRLGTGPSSAGDWARRKSDSSTRMVAKRHAASRRRARSEGGSV